MAAASDKISLEVLAHDVDGLKKVVSELALGFSSLKEAILSIPKQSSVHERVKTISYTVGIYTTLLALLGYFVSAQLAPDRQMLAMVAKQTEDLAVWKYRVQQLERKTP
jgi:hypothetical protein